MAWNRQENKIGVSAPSRGNGWLKGLVAAMIVVLGALLAFVICRRNTTVEDATKPEKTTNAAMPTVSPMRPVPKPQSTAEVPAHDPRFPYTDGRKVISSHTNNWNQIIDICIMPNGKTRKVIRSAKPPVFSNASDQIIAMAVSGDFDEELPPIPISEDMESDFLESLKTPIAIDESDSDAVKEAKRRVIDARQVIEGEIKKGRSFHEILTDHLAQRMENAKTREMAMSAVSDLKKEGDPELLNEYLEKVNGLMREKGLREVDIPLSRRERKEKGIQE